MTDTVTTLEESVVVVQGNDSSPVVVVQEPSFSVIEIVSVGPQGPSGDVMGEDVFFKISNRFFEVAGDQSAQLVAIQNLGLSSIDGGTFN